MSAPRLPTKTMPVPLSDSAGFVATAISHHPGALPFARAYSAGGDELRNSLRNLIVALGVSALIVVFLGTPQSAYAGQPTYDPNRLAGEVATVTGTAGLPVPFSAPIDQEAAQEAAAHPAATLTPGVERLTGGIYDAGGDPALAFDSRGQVFYAGLGFDRTSAPNTVAVNKGTFDARGKLSWSQPTFINQTASPSTLNDKEWI